MRILEMAHRVLQTVQAVVVAELPTLAAEQVVVEVLPIKILALVAEPLDIVAMVALVEQHLVVDSPVVREVAAELVAVPVVAMAPEVLQLAVAVAVP
jgi:hypothetical protein